MVLTLLLLSCSLLNPSLATEKTLQSSAQGDKSVSLARSVLTNDAIYCVVATGYEEGLINLRVGAGVDFYVLVVLPENTKLEVLDDDDWLKVRTAEGVAGYMNSKYCKLGE